MPPRTTYKEGDLVEFISRNNWTLCVSRRSEHPALRECPSVTDEVPLDPDHDNLFARIEGKVGLIVYVIRNRLEQHMGYRVLISGKEFFCKALVAEKYFKLLENNTDESRGSCTL